MENQITIDTKSVPQETKQCLAAATLDFVKKLKADPATAKKLKEKT